MIDSKTEVLGLIGFPVKHSLSPQIHNYLFKKLNINAVYLCFEVRPQKLKNALLGVTSLGFKGLNVTIPHKEKIIKYLDKIEKEAKLIGAVNTVKIEKGKLYGFNTDGKGFILSLKKYNFFPKGKNILILGAGGAAKAVSTYLAKEKAEVILFYDILYKKALNLTKKLKSFYPKLKYVKALKEKKEIDLKNIDLLINATGIGLKKNDAPVLELKNFHKKLIVYDLIYNPLEPVMLKEAKKRDLFTINGLWMLIYQALYSENIWWNQEFSSFAEEIYKFISKKLLKT
jgi:shikimate dehydrogenase